MKTASDNQVTFEISLATNLLPSPTEAGYGSADNAGELPAPDDDIQADFDPELSKADRTDCLIAAAGGTLAAAIGILWVGEFSLARAQNWGHEEADALVVQAARLVGFEGDDLQKAIEYLEKVFPLAVDKLTAEFGGGLQHHLRDFAHHPTPVGLLFSILSQFTGKGYGTDTSGVFVVFDLPEGAPVGANFAEKVFNGTVRWAFHLISDLDGSSSSPGAGTGIPGPLLSLLKEVSSLPLFRDIAVHYKGDDIGLSKLLSKLFNGTAFPHEGNKDLLRFDLRTEMGVAHELARQAVPVVLNECVVRATYSIRRLALAAKASEAKGLADFARIDPRLYLPANGRALTRMLTVAHGTFMAIDAAQASVRAATEAKGGKAAVAVRFLLNVNVVGVGRFAFACKADAKYIADDISELYRSYFAEHCGQVIDLAGLRGLDRLTLDPAKARLLNSLKYHKALWDASSTKDEAKRARKMGWCVRWAQQAADAFADGNDAYVIEDEDEAYGMLCREVSASADTSWLSVLALELSVFEPYTRLDGDEEETRDLKCAKGYEEKVFCECQGELSREELGGLNKAYKSAGSRIEGKAVKAAAGVAAVAAVGLVTGGAAYLFAPQIAVVLAGGGLGLSGAALTSASLAAVGGGSLAAGGLGMAGGTAIIAGGGALLGVAGGGAVSATSAAILTSDGFALNECSKLLAFCEVELSGRQGDLEAVREIHDDLKASTERLKEQLDSPGGLPGEYEDDKAKKRAEKRARKCVTRLERTYSEIERIYAKPENPIAKAIGGLARKDEPPPLRSRSQRTG